LQRRGDVRAGELGRRGVAAGDQEQVVALVVAQPEGAGQRGQHLLARLRTALLFQARVVVGGHGGERRDLLASQARSPPARTRGQADVFRPELFPAAAQEGREFRTIHKSSMEAISTLTRDRRSPDERSLPPHGAQSEARCMDISGNTVFIPGATSGIGLALAHALRERGNTVIVGGRRTEFLEKIEGLETVRIDTTDADSVQAAAKDVLARFPALNVLITMAGVMRVEDWHRAQFLESAENIVTTNVLGPIRLIAAFVEHLQTRPDATIMTVSSGLAFAPLKVTPSYNASKAAIHMLSESLRLQLADTSVRVVELEPPSVRTDLLPGQAENDHAMPLDEYVAEVMGIIETQPDVREIQVERVKFLRYGEARGDYEQVVAALNASDPHGD
jgi:uncharacterized oxidoreductase